MSALFFATKALRHKGIILLWVSFAGITCTAQIAPNTSKVFATEEVNQVSIDRLGEFYLVMKNGLIKKYDTLGNFMQEYSNPEFQKLTLLEPWNPLRVFIYSREKQEIALLSHDLELLEKIDVDPAWAVEPCLASPSIGNNFWVLDQSDVSLKWIDAKTHAVLREMNLKLPVDGKNAEFIFLREYQNLLFLVDRKSGIYVLNTIGKLIFKIDILNLDYIGFSGEDFYYLENGILKLYDLYTEERHEYKVDPLARFVLITDNRMILVKSASVEVREFVH